METLRHFSTLTLRHGDSETWRLCDMTPSLPVAQVTLGSHSRVVQVSPFEFFSRSDVRSRMGTAPPFPPFLGVRACVRARVRVRVRVRVGLCVHACACVCVCACACA